MSWGVELETLTPAQLDVVFTSVTSTLGTCRDGDGVVYLHAKLPDELAAPLCCGEPDRPPQSAVRLGAWLCERLSPWLEAEAARVGAVGATFTATSNSTPLIRWTPRAQLN